MPTISRLSSHSPIAVRLGFALLLGAASALAHAGPALAQETPPPLEAPAVCVSSQPSASSSLARKDSQTRFDGEAFVRTELYFGSERPDLPEVSPEEFKSFLDIAVTPCFP